MAKAGRGDDQYMVRFPEGLRGRIKAKAEENGRSMNSEIVARLEESFQDSLGFPPNVLEPIEQRAALLKVPVRTLILDALEKAFPSGYTVGEFIDKWVRIAAVTPSPSERSRIIDSANEDPKSRLSELEIRELSTEGGEVHLIILFGGSGLVASMPVLDDEASQ